MLDSVWKYSIVFDSTPKWSIVFKSYKMSQLFLNISVVCCKLKQTLLLCHIWYHQESFLITIKLGEKNGLIINSLGNGLKQKVFFKISCLVNVIIDFCKVFDSIDPASHSGTWKLILVPFYSLGSLLWKKKVERVRKLLRHMRKSCQAHALQEMVIKASFPTHKKLKNTLHYWNT